jgi:hypothetical protein
METRNEILTQLLKDNYLLNDYLDCDHLLNDEIDNIDEFSEIVQERINETEIIYYSEAMKLLNVHDTSLTISLSLASDFGYNTIDLNSELLATLLIQQMLSEELNEIIDGIEKQEIFNY